MSLFPFRRFSHWVVSKNSVFHLEGRAKVRTFQNQSDDIFVHAARLGMPSPVYRQRIDVLILGEPSIEPGVGISVRALVREPPV